VPAHQTLSRGSLDVYSLGLKLRTLRAAGYLTLSRLAAATGLSTGLLSKLETDRMVPTFSTLERICRVYGIGLGYFFCEPQQHFLAITRRAHIVDGRELPSAKSIPLHAPIEDGKLISKILQLPAGVASTFGGCGNRTELTAYVLEGTLHVSIAGSPEVLEQGDCIVVNTDQVLVLSAAADSRCRALIVSAK